MSPSQTKVSALETQTMERINITISGRGSDNNSNISNDYVYGSLDYSSLNPSRNELASKSQQQATAKKYPSLPTFEQRMELIRLMDIDDGNSTVDSLKLRRLPPLPSCCRASERTTKEEGIPLVISFTASPLDNPPYMMKQLADSRSNSSLISSPQRNVVLPSAA
jgi:hypothetical protein